MKIPISENASVLLSLLESAGHSAYIVGGCVRDAIMKRKPFDFDITTSATTENMLEIFSSFHCLTHGIKHGTVAVVFENDIVECTTYRIDGEYSDARHPDSVTFSSHLKDDLSRRDFTVNALAYNDTDGLIDLFGGTGDIEKKIIRAIGDPDKRFNEDALRIMRGLRFSATLGFSIEKSTGESMRKNSSLLSRVSSERITAEFEKMLTGKNIEYILENFGDILSTVIPDLTLKNETVIQIKNCPAEYDLRLFTMLRHESEPIRTLQNSRIMLKKSDRRTLESLFSMKKPTCRADIKRLLGEFGEENVEKFLRAISDEFLLSELVSILENGECYSIKQLCISGEELRTLGYRGREIGALQEKILEEIILGNIANTNEDVMHFLGTDGLQKGNTL